MRERVIGTACVLACLLAIPVQVRASSVGLPVDAPPSSLPLDAPYSATPIITQSPLNASIYAFSFEFGARYFLSAGKSRFTLGSGAGIGAYADVSRLTFSTGATNAGEVYGKVKHVSGAFVKASGGLSGRIGGGHLQDQDFEPYVSPYSSTNSDQRGGRISYANVDLGYAFLRARRYELAGFVGYQYLAESYSAYGCAQTAANPDVCAPGDVAPGVEVITDSQTWNAVRLGLAGEVYPAQRIRLALEGAFLPYVRLDGSDLHHLRQESTYGAAACNSLPGACFDGATPVAGHGLGMQFEGKADYFLTRNWTLGVGARYWDMRASGNARLDLSAVPAGAFARQPVRYRTERYGGFVQTGFKF